MKPIYFFLIVMIITGYAANAQNLHTHANAASINNEANSTAGWTGAANLTSVTTTPQNGTWALRVLSTATGGRDARYTFNAVVGTVYNITIWARRGVPNSNPAFANWSGVSGFAVTTINSQNWTQFNFTVTATNTSPTIVAYAAPIGAAAGQEIFIDNVSIVAQGGGGDTQPPTAPTNLAASNTTSTATTLNWTASTDNVGVTEYQIRRNNVMVGSVAGNTTTYNATGLTASTSYNFNVVALDAANNVSPASNTVQVTTTAGGGGGDTQPPTAPSNLAASNTTSTGTTLNWNASTDNVGVTQYQIRQNGNMIGSVAGNVTTFNVSGLSPSTGYNFNVVALDAANNVSNPSNTVQVTTTSGGGGGGGEPYTTQNANLPTVNWQGLNLYASGSMGIGTNPNSNFRLAVNGNIRAKEVIVESGWSDFVFDDDYILPTIQEVESFIKANRHLKDIPTAAQVQQNGVGLAEINTLLLQKIEELTLYIIQIDKRIQQLESHNNSQ